MLQDVFPWNGTAFLWCQIQTITLPKFNIAPEKLPSQQESGLPTNIFQGLC